MLETAKICENFAKEAPLEKLDILVNNAD